MDDDSVWVSCPDPIHEDPPLGEWTCPTCRGWYFDALVVPDVPALPIDLRSQS